jgi:hypothetical protein
MDDLSRDTPDGDAQISLGEILRRIGLRGFGPILVIVSGLLLLPIGMIPGVPGAVAIVMGLVAVELVSGGKAIRLPGRIARLSLRASLVSGSVARARPVTRVIGRLLRPRAVALATARPVEILLGLVLGTIAVVMFVVGFVPGLPFLLAIPVLLIGLGLTARDSLVLFLGLVAALAPAAYAWRLLL